MTNPQSQDDQNRLTESLLADLEIYVAGLVNSVEKGLAKEVAPYGLTSLEFSLLRACFEDDGEHTATQLAQILPIDGARISRLVNGLVDRGLLRRRRLRSDRRVVMLRLTEEGMDLTSHVLQSMRRYHARLTEGIGEEDMRVFVAVSSKIIANHATMEMSE